MSVKFVFRELTLTAGQRKRVHEVASFFMLVSNTGDLKIRIAIDDDPLSDIPTGYEYREPKEDSFYSHIDFLNPNVGEVTIEYVMSSGIVRSSPTITELGGILAELQGDLTPETWGDPVLVSNVVATELLAANADRKGLLMQIEPTETESVWIGFDNSVTDSHWVRCLAGVLAIGIYDVIFRMNDYRGPIWAKASDLDHPVYVSEW